MYERFTVLAKRAVTESQDAALALGHDFIGTGHQLLGLACTAGVASEVLRAHGVELGRARDETVRQLEVAGTPATGGQEARDAPCARHASGADPRPTAPGTGHVRATSSGPRPAPEAGATSAPGGVRPLRGGRREGRHGGVLAVTRPWHEAVGHCPGQDAAGKSAEPLTRRPETCHAGYMPEDTTCPACEGDRITEHTEHTVETDANGHHKPVTRSWIGPCSICHGTGIAP